MNDYFDAHRNDPSSVASLIYFAPHVSLSEAKAVIDELRRKGLVDGDTTREYQEAFGSPVWYIP